LEEFTGWQFAFEINWPLDSAFAHEAGKHHQTFPNVSAHQIIDIIAQVEQINKNGKLLLKENVEANSTQCSQAVTHPSTD
jgi:hypothetical protein